MTAGGALLAVGLLWVAACGGWAAGWVAGWRFGRRSGGDVVVEIDVGRSPQPRVTRPPEPRGDTDPRP